MTSIPQHYLLIDNNPTVQRLTQVAFGQLQPEGTLTCVPSGQGALELLESVFALPDVILLDVNTSGITGFHVFERLKDDPQLRSIPVVMLTTPDAASDVTHAYSLLASSSLVKSEAFKAFMTQVELVLGFWQALRVTHSPGYRQTRAAP